MSTLIVVARCAAACLLLSSSATGAAAAQDRSPKDTIRLFVAADATRANPNRVSKQVDVEESASELRKRVKSLRSVELVNQPAGADLIVTVTGRYKDADRGLVLNYILEAGDYKVVDEFAAQGGSQITGGIRTLESDGRASTQGQRPLSWDALARQFAQSLDGFVKANHDRILSRRSRER